MEEEKSATTTAVDSPTESPVVTVEAGGAVTTADPAAAAEPQTEPVEKTKTAKDKPAQKEKVETIVVAAMDGKYRRFSSREQVPKDVRVYTTRGELQGQTLKQLEMIHSLAVGAATPTKFESHAKAVTTVWETFSSLPLYTPPAPKELPADAEEDAKVEPKAEKSFVAARSGGTYRIKPTTPESETKIAKLAPQARSIAAMIRADGRTQFSEEELKALIVKNAKELRTRQEPWRIFQYYRSKMIGADLLTHT